MSRASRIGWGLALCLAGTGFAAAAPGRPAATAKRPAAVRPPAANPVEVPPPDFRALARGAVERSLPLLQKSAATFSARRTCLSCHHQLLTAMTLRFARDHGFAVDEPLARTQAAEVRARLIQVEELLRAAPTDATAERQLDHRYVNPAITVGYIMAAMEAQRHPRNEVAGLLAAYLGRKQAPDGRFPVLVARPPQEGSEFTATALAVAGLRAFAPSGPETERRIERAREWLRRARPKTSEDASFRLMGLKWSGAEPEAVRAAAAELLDAQQDDGGWAQLPGASTDAYATGLALVALREGGLPTTDSVYFRGVAFLLFRQRPDGSWRVASRSWPVQPYFETGFPHGRDQFISAAATAWALMAVMPAVATLPTTPEPEGVRMPPGRPATGR